MSIILVILIPEGFFHGILHEVIEHEYGREKTLVFISGKGMQHGHNGMIMQEAKVTVHFIAASTHIGLYSTEIWRLYQKAEKAYKAVTQLQSVLEDVVELSKSESCRPSADVAALLKYQEPGFRTYCFQTNAYTCLDDHVAPISSLLDIVKPDANLGDVG
ncbi:hypothetical protein H0H87_004627, partial [Tephrocybe sp. NHM501043]